VAPSDGAGGTPGRGAPVPTAVQAGEHLEPAACPQGDPPQRQQYPHPRPHNISPSRAFIPGCRPAGPQSAAPVITATGPSIPTWY